MANRTDDVYALYSTDAYLGRFPGLFTDDSAWKLAGIIPLLDKYHDLAGDCRSPKILDVGGGAGMILHGVARYFQDKFQLDPIKYALDLSPGMLEQQQKHNPDICKALSEDICRTSLADKEVDLTLLIDVLEHIPDPRRALQEVGRISRYAILKVPLEDNFISNLTNRLNRGKTRRLLAEELGHINYYNPDSLVQQVSASLGRVHFFAFTGVYEFNYQNINRVNRHKAAHYCLNRLCALAHRLSPYWAARFYTDFALLLVESRVI